MIESCWFMVSELSSSAFLVILSFMCGCGEFVDVEYRFCKS